MLELLIILLPVAAASGWYSAFKYYKPHSSNYRPLEQAYIRGIHYLLNEKPDQALGAFTDGVASDHETTEFHLALGNFFRRRGEVEKAIQIHQKLIDKQTLNKPELGQVSFELGQDFLSAGLYDRAETIFIALAANHSKHKEPAMQCLLHIYQQEKDWLKAIKYTRLLTPTNTLHKGEKTAHFYCELAVEAQQAHCPEKVQQYLRLAQQEEPDNIRVNILNAQIALNEGHSEWAFEQLKSITQRAPQYIPVILPQIQSCCEYSTGIDGPIQYLQELHKRFPVKKLTILLATLLKEHQGTEKAIEFLTEAVSQHPSLTSLNQLINLELTLSEGETYTHLQQFQGITQHLINNEITQYRCKHCGFNAIELHWLCPGCCHWESILPTA